MNILQDLFLTILNMSITASFVALGVMLVRLLLRKAPKVFSYILWAAVFFRLICPVSFTSDFSFLSLINTPQNVSMTEYIPDNLRFMETPAISPELDNVDRMANASLLPAVPTASGNPLPMWTEVFSLIWIAGVLALLIYSVVSYVRTKRRLQTATRVEGNVYETDAISTAFVCGFIRPKIYVPVGVGAVDLAYILEHERTHIRRRDYLIKPLAFLALILHWFNPLMWLSFRLMSRDMEMSCDEGVLSRLGESIKDGYSGSLLSLSLKRTDLLTVNPLAFGESHVKARIINVLNYKKPAFWVIILAVVVVCLAAVAFAANPKDKEADNLAQVTSLAQAIIDRDIANYELNPEVNIIDRKITRLELVETFKALAETPIDVYALEYRLLPEDLSKVVLAGGMQVDEDGWLKETCSMGSPLLVIARQNGAVELIGTLWTGGVIEDGGLESSVKALLNKEVEVEKLVEENLAIIMSSPKESSNPQAYIDAHPLDYEKIKKYGGEEALQYMLSQFEAGNADGLRGQLMMRLCKELLGVRNNVTDESLSPSEWYAALSIRAEIKLPDFTYDGDDPLEKMVYATEIQQNSAPGRGFTVVAPRIFGSYEENGFLKVFVTTYSSTYRLYGNVLDRTTACVVPKAITYKKDENGNYVLEKYEPARDGGDFGSSIRDFCVTPVSGRSIPGLADEILKYYGNYSDIQTLQYQNLYKHLKAHGITDATLTRSDGEVIFSMNNTGYKP